MASSTLITDEAYREHAAFWTTALGAVADDFHFRQPWLSRAPDAAATIAETLAIPDSTAELLRRIAGGTELGLFAVVASALASLLHTCTGSPLVVVDTPPLALVDGAGGDDLVPLVLTVDAASTLRDHISRASETVAASYSFQQYPIAHACEMLLRRPRPRTNILAAMTGVHAIAPNAGGHDLAVTVSAAPLQIRFVARTPAFSADYVRGFARHLRNVLAACGDLSQTLKQIDVMGADERTRVLVDYNASRQTGAAPDHTIHARFEAQVARAPEQTAVRLHDEALSYDALNRSANRLARFLQADYNIQPGDVVGIVSDRSPLTIAGILGVLKAGAVYLPLDADYPEERLQFLVGDAGVKALLVHSEQFPRLASLYETPMFALDLQLATLEHADTNLAAASGPRDLAYIIYTSGSTGQPKGVLLEHRGFVNMVQHHIAAFGVEPSDRLLQFYGHSFDSSLFEIFVSLLSGATLVMVGRDTINDPEQLSAYIDAQQVTSLTLPPVYQSTLDRAKLTSVRRFVSAGDNARVDDAVAFARHARYFNSYGPTETSVCVTHHEVRPDARYGSRIPIGSPISHTSIYLLDDDLSPVPEGVPGEICVGGVSLARGYLGRDELTAQKFVADPFEPGGRLYRTGDLGVWLPGGSLELLGRKDNQVKIRGYRIELGEIESVLAQDPHVRETVVVASEDESGYKRLVAYATGDASLDVEDLKALLRSRLPEFMIPSVFVVLPAMPLTANGKIDRKALPPPSAAATESAGAPPENEIQETLLSVWLEVLGRERIGIHDNLFELGGDSILVIQIVSRARQVGLKLVPNQLFEHQTIAALSRVAAVVETAAVDEGPVEGDAPLSPMQEWFFERAAADRHHFNQSVAFEVPADFDAVAGEMATRAVLDHHDALRLRFTERAGSWSAAHAEPGGDTPFASIDLSALPADEQQARRRELEASHQAGFDLGTGPLVRVVLFRFGPNVPAHLLFIVHHLVVDGVSWRLLLEDFRTAYDQARRGDAIALPAKTSSFRMWTTKLRQRASALSDERDYWTSAMWRDVDPLPADLTFDAAANTVGSAREIRRVLDSETTSALLHEAPRAYTTEINDLLLTALAETLGSWTGRDRVLIDLEGHGREDLVEGVDTSRTVGWLTSQFPVLLTVDPSSDPGDSLKSAKEQLRAIPRRGAAYGVLRYLSADAAPAAELKALPHAGVLFNYLGQSGRASGSGDRWMPLASATALEISARAVRTHLIEINAIVLDGQLTVAWTYSEAVHRRDTIEALAAAYEDALRRLVDHCRSVTTRQFTPSDFPAARLDQQSLDALIAKISNS